MATATCSTAGKRSDVWKFYTQEATNSVVCKLCERKFAYHGGTSNLRDHSQVYKPSAKQTDSKQTTIIGLQRCTERRAKVVSDMILNMIIKDIRPIAIVEGEGFQEMMHLVEPGYKVPSRKYFTKSLHLKYSEGVKNLKKMLTDEASSLAITTDIWTSSTNDSYIPLTIHFVTKEWETRNCILETRSFPEHHKGANIADKLKDMMSVFDIENSKVVAVVHDQG